MSTRTFDVRAVRRRVCEESYPDFVRYIRIKDPPPGGGIIVPEPWPHLLELDRALLTHRLIVLVKAKQVGATWRVAGYVLWVAMYHRGATVSLFSKGQDEAIEFLDGKVRLIYNLLPAELQEPMRGDGSREELQFPRMYSQIKAYPATKTASVGKTSTLAVMDEADLHEYFQENYDLAAKPTAAAGGQVIVLSTVDPESIESGFKQLVRGAGDGVPGPNGFVRMFFPWGVRPGRDEAWYRAEMASSLNKTTFLKNYPNSVDEALAPAQTALALDREALLDMQQRCREPLETRAGGVVHVWQRYRVGGRYVAFTDTSHGVGKDDSVTAVLDVSLPAVVADVHSNVIDHRSLALVSSQLLKDYQNPLWAIEDNDWGKAVLAAAEDLGYPHLYAHKVGGPKGFHTTERNRPELWAGLQELVKSGGLTVPSKAGMAQFWEVIRNVDKGGRMEAIQGGKDDYPFAVAGAWQLRGEVKVAREQLRVWHLGSDGRLSEET